MCPRPAHEALNPQTIGGAFEPPMVGCDRAAEQAPGHRLLRRPREQGIGDAQFEYPLRCTALARHQRGG